MKHSWMRVARPLALGLLLALARPLPAASPAHAQAAGPQYLVQAGDTLYAIALQFGVSLEALQAANPGVDPAALAIGQALILPGYAEVSGTLAVHVFQPGESLGSLAVRLGLKRETLVRLNHVVNPERLYINEPVVVVLEADAGPPVDSGVNQVVAPQAGLLALAAAHNQNAWALAARNRLVHPGRALPGGDVIVPGGEHPPKALPYPLLDLQVMPFPLAQGRTVAVRLVTARPIRFNASSLGPWPLVFNTEAEGRYVALAGIYRLAEPDLYPLALDVTPEAGPRLRFQQAVPVRAADYGSDPPLRVDPATIDPAVTEPELQQIKALVAPITPRRLWDGAFALPSVGAIRSRFGSLRSYNGSAYDTFHTGTDFSGAEDRPVTAPAPGVVVFAGALTVRGNATLIDHGWGVYTGYWHQSAMTVQVGQSVTPGQVIGYQGATGRVTGPHLHWEVWVGGVQVDPLQWTEAGLP